MQSIYHLSRPTCYPTPSTFLQPDIGKNAEESVNNFKDQTRKLTEKYVHHWYHLNAIYKGHFDHYKALMCILVRCRHYTPLTDVFY